MAETYKDLLLAIAYAKRIKPGGATRKGMMSAGMRSFGWWVLLVVYLLAAAHLERRSVKGPAMGYPITMPRKEESV